jgi:hypothetical protein
MASERALSRWRWLGVCLAFVLLVACSGDDDWPEATPSPSDSASPTATSGPVLQGAVVSAQSLGLQTVAVKWTPADVLDLRSLVEATDPFATELGRLPLPPGAPKRWSVRLVEGQAPPRELQNSTRLLTDLAWGTDGLQVAFQTRREVRVIPFGGPITAGWQGTTTFDLPSGGARDQFAAFPMEVRAGQIPSDPQSTRRSVTVHLDRQKRQAVLTVGSGDAPFRQTESVYILNADGTAKRLEGLSGLGNVGLLPAGNGLMAGKGWTGRPSNASYFVPTTDGQAIFFGEMPVVVEGASPDQKSPRPRALMVAPDPAQPNSGARLLVLYDYHARQLRVLGPGPTIPILNPAGFPTQIPMSWPAGSNEVAIGTDSTSSNAAIVDVRTGATRPGQVNDLTPPPTPGQTSPNGHYTAQFAVQPVGPSGDCLGQPLRLEVKDNQTGETRTLLECSTGSTASATWLDNNRLVATAGNCRGCDYTKSSQILVDVVTGKATLLTDGVEPSTRILASPDKSRLLVAGKSLRVYGADGKLERDVGPIPEGATVISMVWSPDGGSFAYVVGPAGFWGPLP